MRELPYDERWVWIGLLLLAGDSPFEGRIGITEDIGYNDDQIAGLLETPVDIYISAKEKMIKHDKISVDKNGIIKIVNWKKYQSEYGRLKKYRYPHQSTKKSTSKSTSKSHEEIEIEIKKEIKKEIKNKKRKIKQKDIVPTFGEVDVFLTNLLIELMEENLPNSHIVEKFKKTESTQTDWMRQCRLMRERDNRTPIEIETLIRWSQKDEFWRSNILSISKLRKQFDRLLLQAKKTNYAGIRAWLKEVENDK